MKRIILSISALALFLTSCSNDEVAQITPLVNSELKLVTTSNTTGKVSYINLLETTPTAKSVTINGIDADGAFFNSETDELMLASRTNNTLQLYKGLNNSVTNNTDALLLQASTSNTNFNNPREIAVSGDKVIVTQDQNTANANTNKFIVYQKTSSGFTLLNTYVLNFKVWGIHIEGTTLYAVADSSSDLLVFENLFVCFLIIKNIFNTGYDFRIRIWKYCFIKMNNSPLFIFVK